MNGQMMPGGIAGGAPQPQMPPQGAVPPMGGGMPPMGGGLAAMRLPMPQDADPRVRLNKLMMIYQQEPSIDLLGRIKETRDIIQAQNAVQQQMAMMQGQQAMAQGTVADQVVGGAEQELSQGIDDEEYSYAAGGIVSFAGGGSTDEEIKRILAKGPYLRTPEENALLQKAGYELTQRKLVGDETPTDAMGNFFRNLFRRESPTPVAAGPSSIRGKSGDPNVDIGAIASAAPGTRPLGAPGAPGAPRPAGSPLMGPPMMSDIDRMAMLEPEFEAQSKRLQELYQRQGQADPELTRLRQSAYELSESTAKRREADRQAALQAAREQMEAPLIGNQEALLRMAGALGGAKRFGEALSAAAGAAGTVRGEQRKTYEAAQKVSREEQIALDTLRQALAEKRVADRSGDVDRIRAAELNVEQARKDLLGSRFTVRKEVAAEADRAAQRRIQERQAAASELSAQAAMTAASTRGADKGITAYQMLKLRERAAQDVDKQFPTAKAKAQSLFEKANPGKKFDEDAFRRKMIEDRMEKILREEVSLGTPGASPGAAGQSTVLNWDDISKPKS